MKKNNSLGKTLNFYSMLLFIISIAIIGCGKDPLPINPIVPPTPVPEFTSTKATTAWFNGTSDLSWSAKNATAYAVGNGDFNSATATTVPGTSTSQKINIKAKGSGGITSVDITVPAMYSQRMTFWCNYGPVHMTSFKVCDTDSLSNPSAWHAIPPDCNTTKFNPDGTGQVTMGACSPNPGTVWPFSSPWALQNNDSKYWNGSKLWDVDFIDTSGFQISIIEADAFNPNNFFKTVLVYSH